MSSVALTLPGGFIPDQQERWGKLVSESSVDIAIRSGSPEKVAREGRRIFSEAKELGAPEHLQQRIADMRRLVDGTNFLDSEDRAALVSIQQRLLLHAGQVHSELGEKVLAEICRLWLSDAEGAEYSALQIVLSALDAGDGAAAFARRATAQVSSALEHFSSATLYFTQAGLFLPTQKENSEPEALHTRVERLGITSSQVLELAMRHISSLQNSVRLLDCLPESKAARGDLIQDAVRALKQEFGPELHASSPKWLHALEQLQQLSEQFKFAGFCLEQLRDSFMLKSWIASHAKHFAEALLSDGRPELVEPTQKIAFRALGYRFGEGPECAFGRMHEALYLAGLLSTLANAKQSLAKWGDAQLHVEQGLLLLREVHERILNQAATKYGIQLSSLQTDASSEGAVTPWWVEGADLRKRITTSVRNGQTVDQALSLVASEPMVRVLYQRIHTLAEQGMSIGRFIAKLDRSLATRNGFGDTLTRYEALKEDANEALELSNS